MEILLSLIIAGIIMGILDGLWLGVIAKKLYRKELGSLMLDKPNMAPAFLFYIIYVIGIFAFVIHPSNITGSLLNALLYGGLFGLVAYGTYDLTNVATLKNFSKKIVLIDLAWGTFISAFVSVSTVYVVSLFVN